MQIAEIRQQIEISPDEKDSKIKEAVFADLSDVIKSYQDLIDLIDLYPTEKDYRIKDFIFANLVKFLRYEQDVDALIALYPEQQNYLIKEFTLQNTQRVLQAASALQSHTERVLTAGTTLENALEQIDRNIYAPTQSVEINYPPTTHTNISMQILGGFIAALGVAAVAIAFTALNAATLGIPGLVVAGLGAAAILGGVGLFAFGSKKQEAPVDELLSNDFFNYK
ncbi:MULTISPECIES: hypothetical protein [Legionella]|uniref:VipE n=1 Tax=Legionella drozanskii LLAP-1 TaxID=1212489 RepID=A0A0W0ST08_9GAMM|nr:MULTISPECIES: hypothetical protein [Legionella]KTC86101.1 hypothetical protein Ldro_2426 [Legionella drozanskii LLAP-1]PJE17665.1 MAG: hypothetical protein CK430_02115 [Legionella sp.]